MAPIRLCEVGPALSVHLDSTTARRLAVSEAVEVRPGPADGMWSVRAAGKVGAARIGGIELHITPKVPVARLLFLLGYVRDPRFWRAESVSFAEEADLVPALAGALWRQTDRALRQGLPQGYRTVDETAPVLRGRLRETVQLSRRFGAALPLEVRYDDYTVDIAENRILATAVERMSRVPGTDPESRRMLRHLAGRFPGVTRLPAGAVPPPWQPTRTNARLAPALRLAELVLDGASVEAGRGGVLANAFLFDMWRVYEDFLAAALKQSVEARYGGTVLRQATDWLDHGERIGLRPDITWRRDSRIAAVVDAKYKAHMPSGDVYQVLAYCVGYGLRRGHLVYPAGRTTRTGVPAATGERCPVRHVVRNAGIEIVSHALDLGLPPAALLAQVTELADDLVGANRTG